MRRITFTLAALALVASCFTLRTTGAFAAHGAGAHNANTHGANNQGTAARGTSNQGTNTPGTTGKGNAAHTNSTFTATTYTISVLVNGTYQHTYTLTTNPFCSGTLSGTGATPTSSSYYTPETISGSFTPTSVNYTANYTGTYNPGYWYNVSTTNVTQTGPNSYSFSGYITTTTVPVTGWFTMNSTTYQNTGSYVRTLSDAQKAAFQSACGTTTSGTGEDQDTDEGSTSGTGEDQDTDEGSTSGTGEDQDTDENSTSGDDDQNSYSSQGSYGESD